MPELVALALDAGPDFVATVTRVWDRGDAVLPLDPGLPPTSREHLLDAMGAARVVDPLGERERPGDHAPVRNGDAVVIATSGTSGESKGVVLTHEALRASALANADRMSVDPASDTWLACLPLNHIGGFAVVVRSLTTGTPLDVHPRFDPRLVEQAGAERATLVSLVPTAYRRCDTSGFRNVLLGGDKPPEELADNVVVSYGMSESGSGIVYDGLPLGGAEFRIADDGEIHLRGPMLLRCYRDGTDPKDPAGWLPTGDLGSVDRDGRLQVTGRKGDLIITGGKNVRPLQVEGILRAHPDVAEVAVVGRADVEWGQEVTAVIVPAPGAVPTLESLRSFAKELLPAYAAPRRLELRESLPRTALGKIRRSAL